MGGLAGFEVSENDRRQGASCAGGIWDPMDDGMFELNKVSVVDAQDLLVWCV